ncbi:MAG: hypothetical protein HND52_20190 [Ignavibacteriae bacterium]|jgi:predicted thioredoxin/glutaredoxin|nr:hypothetical protein [Ignavibacteriota bacterium]NOH00291.1 hypothetical protein [Ignavibacteriota bacterium]
MNFTLFITADCSTCEKVEKNLRMILKSNSRFILHVENIDKENPKNIVIVPALFIEDKLFAYGEVDYYKLTKYVKSTKF